MEGFFSMSNAESREKTKRVLGVVIKTFLLCNPGKKFSSREICDFVNNNRVGLQGGVNPKQVSRYLNMRIRQGGIYSEVKREKNKYGRWRYYV